MKWHPLNEKAGQDLDTQITPTSLSELLQGNHAEPVTFSNSPSGRFDATKERRVNLRALDRMSDIDFFGSSSNDNSGVAPMSRRDVRRREMSKSGQTYISNQAFMESLRSSYTGDLPAEELEAIEAAALPLGEKLSPSRPAAREFDGGTHTSRSPPIEHLEAAVRRRAGIASPGDWQKWQMHLNW